MARSERHSDVFTTATKISLTAFFLLVVSAFATATAIPKPTAVPCAITAEEAAGLGGDLSTDIHAIPDYKATVARMLKEGKFRQLDCVAHHARSSKEKFSGGLWKLHALYQGIDQPVPYPLHATQKDWNALLKKLQQWVNLRPRSITARVALASAYVGYAWDARGDGYADTISETGQTLFAQRIRTARQILDKASTLRTKCPEWYVTMQGIATAQGWGQTEAHALFDQATRFEPGYYYFARVYANYLLPKWYGEEGDVAKFAQEVADSLGGDEGNILYFRIASYVICGCGNEPHLSWPRIEKGFEASEKQYGVSMLNLNLIAYLATHYADLDPVVADKTFTRIGEQWDEETWKRKEEFDTAKKWAAGYAPMAAKRRAMEDAAEANLQTPDGLRYKAAFEAKYKALVQECVRTEGSSSDKFETLTEVGEGGRVADIRIYWNGPAAMCVYQKLHTFQTEKATPFPAPSHAPYMIRLDLDAAEFAPVASK